MSNMKQQLIEGLIEHATAHVKKHKLNVEILLNNPVGVGEHGDIMDTIERELNEMATYQDQIDILHKYFL
jgi:hypothetical protein